MSRFIVTTHKEYIAYQWVQRYYVEAPTLTEAANVGDQIIEFEMAIHADTVSFTKVHARTPIEDDYVYVDHLFQGNGALVTNADNLPLFNVAKVNFQTTLGKPDYKQYRTMLNGTYYDIPFAWTIGYGQIIDAAYTEFLLPLITAGSLVDSQGNPWVTYTLDPKIKMRQQHRKRKKKVPPATP